MEQLSARAQGRRLSGAERLWLAGRAFCPPFVIACVAEWEGGLDVARWREAVGRAAASYPAARARLRGFLGGSRWEVSPEGPPVEVFGGEAWDGSAPWARLETPLDPAQVTCEVLLQAGPPTSRLVVRCLHASMDGRGMMGFLGSILHAAHGATPTLGLAGPLTDADAARRLLRGGEETRRLPKSKAKTPLPRGVEARWARFRIEPAPPSPLRALALAVWGQYAPQPVRLAFPVDLRPAEREWAAMGGNLTGVHHLDLDGPVESAPLEAGLAQARERTAAAAWVLGLEVVRGFPLGLLSWLGGRAHARQLRLGVAPTTATLSNLGRVERWVDGLPARVWVLPMTAPGQAMLWTLCGNHGALELVVRGPHDPARWARIVERVRAASTPSLGRP
jgi:hypothetical protein